MSIKEIRERSVIYSGYSLKEPEEITASQYVSDVAELLTTIDRLKGALLMTLTTADAVKKLESNGSLTSTLELLKELEARNE